MKQANEKSFGKLRPEEKEQREPPDKSGIPSTRPLPTAMRGAQGASLLENGVAQVASAVLTAGSAAADNYEKPYSNFDDDFDKGFTFSGLAIQDPAEET